MKTGSGYVVTSLAMSEEIIPVLLGCEGHALQCLLWVFRRWAGPFTRSCEIAIRKGKGEQRCKDGARGVLGGFPCGKIDGELCSGLGHDERDYQLPIVRLSFYNENGV
jgi:hypothetical protein